MHVIESAVLVPMGVGLISLLLMLTFFLHDQTVLTAGRASTMLEWQMSPDGWDEAQCREEVEQWKEHLLITDIQVLQFSSGEMLCYMQTKEVYRLFRETLTLMEQSFCGAPRTSTKISAKIDPCWVRRIWKGVVTA